MLYLCQYLQNGRKITETGYIHTTAYKCTLVPQRPATLAIPHPPSSMSGNIFPHNYICLGEEANAALSLS